jgi:cobalamin biosynthesis Co2+ chelatase CbiK
MNPKLTPSLQEAFKSFQIAEAEVHRPGEDMVTLSACTHLRNSVQSFLQSFLESKSVDIIEQKEFDELLRYCNKLDVQFKAIDLTCFACKKVGAKDGEEKYCLSVEKVNQCFVETKMLKNLVLAKLHLSEKDFE